MGIHSDREPLLASVNETDTLLSPPPSPTTSTETQKKPWIRLLIVCLITIYLIDLGAMMVTAPLVRIYEAVYCVRYWAVKDPSKILPGGHIPEEQCKIDEIQQAVAWIFGWQGVWDTIPGILLGIPYGAMADRWGRKWVITLSFAGIALSAFWIMVVASFDLPLLAVWFSSAFLLIGGGPIVAASMLNTVVADVSPKERLSQNFLYLSSSILVGELVGPAVGSWLMRKNVWYPLIGGAALQVLAVIGTFFLPETIQYKPLPPTVGLHESESNARSPHVHRAKRGIFRSTYDGMKDTICFACQDRNVMLVVLISLLTGLSSNGSTLMLQYFSKRYGWHIADAALLGTLASAVNLLVFLLILPYATSLLLKQYSHSSELANLHITKVSVLLAAAGYFVVGLSPVPILAIFGIVCYILGSGFHATLRTVATSLVGGDQSHDLARLYTTLMLAQAVGQIINNPMVPVLFAWGMERGGGWLGLPYLVSGAYVVVIIVATYAIRLRKGKGLSLDDDELGDASGSDQRT